jgi:hypothetical protein
LKGEPATSTAPSLRCDLTAAATNAWRLEGIHRRHWVRRILQIGPQVGRGSAGEAADVRIFDNDLSKSISAGNERQNPTVVWPAYFPGELDAKR